MTLKSSFDPFVDIDYKVIRNAEIVGLEDFEMKIDQIAATENSGMLDEIKANKRSVDDDWITNLYRQFNDPLSEDVESNDVSDMTLSQFG